MDLEDLKTVDYAVEASIATITLNRPDRLNAWTGRMHTEYRWCIEQAEGNPAVALSVVTGAGRGFCAGADSSALAGHVEKGGYDPGTANDIANPGYGISPDFDHDFAFHLGLEKPVIAAINGPCAGVGFVLACFADIRFAARGAKLTTSHGKLGLPAEFGLSWLLPKIIGLSHANDLLLSSRVITADEACAMGLVNRCVEPAELMTVTLDYANMLAGSVAPSSLSATKRQIYLDLSRSLQQSSLDARGRLESMMKGGEFAEGVAALNGKRPPRWRT